MKKPSVSHGYSKESLEEKARWFQQLSIQERMDLLCFYTDLILSNNPEISKKRNAQSTGGRIQRVTRA
jgi:hypothetical protein